MTSAFDVDQQTSLFSSFNRSEMLPAFPKKQRLISYPQEQINVTREPVSQFLMSHDGLPESSIASTRLEEAHQLEQRGTREQDVYTHQIMSKPLYSTSCPNQALPSVEQLNFSAIQSSTNSGTLGLNWLHDEGQAYSNWSTIDPSDGGQCFTEGSRYNVLSNKLPTRPPYSNSSSEQHIHARNFVGRANHGTRNIYGYAQHQAINPSSHQAVAANNLSWMNYPQQNSSVRNPFGEPLQRSWNK